MRVLRTCLTTAVATVGLVASAHAGEKMPKGPPWHRDFVTAHAEAVRTGKPLFVYFTKTY